MFVELEKGALGRQVVDAVSGKFPTWVETWKEKFTILRSSVLGTVIGIFPGAGATIASFISYGIAKRTSKEPDTFGNGAMAGVASSEAANSSSVGGALIPLLALGIRGVRPTRSSSARCSSMTSRRARCCSRPTRRSSTASSPP